MAESFYAIVSKSLTAIRVLSSSALVDNETGAVRGPAPLFDNGMTLLAMLAYHEKPKWNEFLNVEEAIAKNKLTTPWTATFDEAISIYGKKRHIPMLERLADIKF